MCFSACLGLDINPSKNVQGKKFAFMQYAALLGFIQ